MKPFDELTIILLTYLNISVIGVLMENLRDNVIRVVNNAAVTLNGKALHDLNCLTGPVARSHDIKFTANI